MSKETAPSEKAKKDELQSHEELKASAADQGKGFDDENLVPEGETPKVTSEEDQESLAEKEEKPETGAEETDAEKPTDSAPLSQQVQPDTEAQENIPSSEKPENLGDQILGSQEEKVQETGNTDAINEPAETTFSGPFNEGGDTEKISEETTTADDDSSKISSSEHTSLEREGEATDQNKSGEDAFVDTPPKEEITDTAVTEEGDQAVSKSTEQHEPEQITIAEDTSEEINKDDETRIKEPDHKDLASPETEQEQHMPSEGAISSEETTPQQQEKVTPPVAGDDVEKKTEGDSKKEEISMHEEIEISSGEDDIHDDGDELVHADYSQYSKEDLVATIKKLTKIDDFKKLDLVLNIVDPLFQDIKQSDRKAALDKYIADGGSEEDFAYKNELDQKYDAYYKLIKERKHKFYGDLGRQKLENYQKATELLEKLRHLVDGEESTTSINAIKEVQEQWKAIGQVPPQHVRNLWASYNALMDRFYDNRSIYFELKELDRRKNLKAKEELCVRAEKLEKVENLKEAIKELNELHNEYKHLGPVPKAEQEALWQRFKAASDRVYARRKTYYDDLKKDLEVNLEAKAKLREEVQPFASFDSDRIVDWNKKTQEILDIQKRWEAIGGLPRDRAQEINKPFWSAFKRFFNNKNGFFKKLEGQREENLKLKEELVTKANELKDSSDWNQTANELKKLQNEWRNIGPVPEKQRNEVYQRFKKACDFFFENRRNRFKQVEKEYEKNLKLKEDVCRKILQLAEEGAGDIGQLEALQEEWNNVGFVPKNAIRSSQDMFAKAVDQFIESSSLDEDEKNKLKITTKLTSLKGTPNANRKLNKKEFTLRRQITNLENDISLWKNNLEFFANSKNADQVREEFDQKIERAKKQLIELKAQLKIIRDI